MEKVVINYFYFSILFFILYIRFFVDGIKNDPRICNDYIKMVDASSEFSIDPDNIFRFYYNEESDDFFIENKRYKKVEQEDVSLLISYFDYIHKNYYDDEIFPEGFKITPTVTENDYFYLYDENINKPYRKFKYGFEFYYYDIDTHSLFVFIISN